MRSLFVACALAALCACTAQAAIWRTQSNANEEIQRALVILAAPSPIKLIGPSPHRLLVAAGRRNRDTKEGDLVFWHWTTNLVPRKAVLYFRQRAADVDDCAEGTACESGTDFSRTAMFLRWGLWKLVEYENNDGQDGYSPIVQTGVTMDAKVQEVLLWSPLLNGNTWSDMSVDVNVGAGVTRSIRICTQMSNATDSRLGLRPLVVRICFAVTGSRYQFSGARLEQDPNSAEWSLEILNWQWQGSATSRLALKTSFDSIAASNNPSTETASELSSVEQEGLQLGSDVDAVAMVAWDREVDVSGGTCAAPTTATVHRSVAREGEWAGDIGDATDANNNGVSEEPGLVLQRRVQVLYYSFLTSCHPSRIFWDPQLGLQTAEIAAGAAVAPVVLLSALALGLAAAF